MAEQLNAPLPVSSPQCSRVAILDDDILENVESKLLGLRLSMGGTHVRFETPSTTYITIMDDDGMQQRSSLGGLVAERPSLIDPYHPLHLYYKQCIQVVTVD